MTTQKSFFKKLIAHLHKNPYNLSKDIRRTLILDIKKNREHLESEFEYAIHSIAPNASGQRITLKGNFLAELINGTLCELFPLEVDTLLSFIDELSKELSLSAFFKRAFNTGPNTDLFSFLHTLAMYYQHCVYDRGEPSYKNQLTAIKKIITHLLHKYETFLLIDQKALFMLVALDIPEIIPIAIKRNISLECKNNDNFTPLCIAAQEGAFKCAEVLIKNRVDVNYQFQFRHMITNPLYTLIENAANDDRVFDKFLELLLKNGADPNVFIRKSSDPMEETVMISWFAALKSGNIALIKIFLAYATAQSGIGFPVNIHVTNTSREINAYYFAVLGDKTESGELIQLLIDNGVKFPTEPDSDFNPLTMAIKLKKPLPLIKRMLESFSYCIATMSSARHPLMASLQYDLLIGDTEHFRSLLFLFKQKKYPLPFFVLINMLFSISEQTTINDFTVELIFLLRILREIFSQPVYERSNFLSSILDKLTKNCTHDVLLKECELIRQTVAPSQLLLTGIGSLIVETVSAAYKEELEKDKKGSSVYSTFITYLNNKTVENLIACWNVLLNMSPTCQPIVLYDYLIELIPKTKLLISNFQLGCDENPTLLKILLKFTQIVADWESIPDCYLGLTRQYLPLVKSSFLSQKNAIAVFDALSFEFAIEMKYDSESYNQLLIKKTESIFDMVLCFVKHEKTDPALLIQVIQDCLHELKAASIKACPTDKDSEIAWYHKTLLEQQLAISWLLTQFPKTQEKAMLLLTESAKEIMENPLLLTHRDDDNIQCHFLGVLEKLAKNKQLESSHENFIMQFISGRPDVTFKYFYLNQIRKKIEKAEKRKEKQQQRQSNKITPARQNSQEKHEASPFKPIEDEEPVFVEKTIDFEKLTKKIETNFEEASVNTDKFWRNLFKDRKDRNERFSKNTSSSISTEITTEAPLIQEIFNLELTGHNIPTKKHTLKQLSYPGMTAQFWGIFAVDENACPAGAYEAMETNFNKATISKAGGGIHHDNGELRIHPPGDWRLHASVYQKKDSEGNPIVLAIFDTKFVKHKKYNLTGFYTKNILALQS